MHHVQYAYREPRRKDFISDRYRDPTRLEKEGGIEIITPCGREGESCNLYGAACTRRNEKGVAKPIQLFTTGNQLKKECMQCSLQQLAQ